MQVLRYSNMLCFEPIGKAFSHDVAVSTSEEPAAGARFRPQISIRTVKHRFADTMALHFRVGTGTAAGASTTGDAGADAEGTSSGSQPQGSQQVQWQALTAGSCLDMLSHWCELAWYTAADRRLLLLLMLLNILSPHRFLSRQNLLPSIITLHAQYLQFLKQYTANCPPLSYAYLEAAPDFNEELLSVLDETTRERCARLITRTSIRAHMRQAASPDEPFSLFAFTIAALNDERMFEQSADKYREYISTARQFTPLIAEMLEIPDHK